MYDDSRRASFTANSGWSKTRWDHSSRARGISLQRGRQQWLLFLQQNPLIRQNQKHQATPRFIAVLFFIKYIISSHFDYGKVSTLAHERILKGEMIWYGSFSLLILTEGSILLTPTKLVIFMSSCQASPCLFLFWSSQFPDLFGCMICGR